MKNALLATALVAAFAAAAFSPTANAANTGTINFNGKVIADTCTISVNGSGTSTVTLPTVTTSAFTAAGTTAGTTPFNVALTGCDANVASAAMTFNGSNIDSTSGRLNNTTTAGGSDVQIELLNSGSAVINASNNTNAPTIAIASGAGSTQLQARYYATAASTTAGLVTSTVGFTLTYQ